MDPFDREPTLLIGDHSLTPARLAATAAAGLPAVGFGLLSLSAGVPHAGGTRVDAVFHLVLGAALLVLFGEAAMAIHRATTLGWVLLFGVGGFVGAFAGVVLAELSGARVLAGFVLLVGAWAFAAALVRHRASQRSR